jgi:hypothetical protein
VATKFDDSNVMAVAGCAVVFLVLPQGGIETVDRYSPAERSLMENLTAGGAFFNAWFFRRSVFSQIGNFNAIYKIAGDRDFMFRFALNNLNYSVIDDLVYKYRMHADSLTFDKSDEKRAWSAEEHLAMTSSYLAGGNLPDFVRRLLIRLRTSETVDMAARNIYTGNQKKFIHYFREGSKYEPAWLLKFFQYILKRGTGVLLTKMGYQRHP